MDREATQKTMKAMKAKYKAAKKEGKRGAAKMFKHASARLTRKLKATAPRGSAKHQADAAAKAAEAKA